MGNSNKPGIIVFHDGEASVKLRFHTIVFIIMEKEDGDIVITAQKNISILIIICVSVFSLINVSGKTLEEEFIQSITYDSKIGVLSFMIPKKLPASKKFYLHISGRMFMDDDKSGMSFHIFDDKSINYTWMQGKTYSHRIKAQNLDFIVIEFGLLDDKDNGVRYLIYVYPDGSKVVQT